MVNSSNRHSAQRPCRICGGYDRSARGSGTRCFGFTSPDGLWVNCTRSEHAGNLPISDGSQTYSHRMAGPCDCGKVHGDAPSGAATVSSEPRAEIVNTWDYRDQDNRLVFQVVKFRPKSFRQRKPDGQGDWVWNLRGVKPLIYRLPELLASSKDQPVFILEGEKDVDRIRMLGGVATTNPMGAGKWKPEYSRYLEGRNVIIVPDDDPPDPKRNNRCEGLNHANQVKTFLQGIAASVKILQLTHRGNREDVSDWLDTGGTLEELLRLAQETPLADTVLHVTTDQQHTNGRGPTEEEHYTDWGFAQRIITLRGEDMRYAWPWSSWLKHDTTRWNTDAAGAVYLAAKEAIQVMYKDVGLMHADVSRLAQAGQSDAAIALKKKADALWEWARKSEATSRIEAALSSARSEPGIAVRPEELDVDPWSLNVLNGTINLQTGEVRPHRKTDLITKLAPVVYQQGVQLNTWARFLEEAIPDPDTRRYIKRCVGASIAGVAPDDILLFLHGPGGTGKSTFLGAIQKTLGDYAASAELTTFTTARDAHGPQPDMARLRGRRMITVSETDAGGALVSLLKRASGGDSIITRSHHQETFEFTPQWTLWLVGNERPRVPDNDTGVWRRMREIPFTTKFEKPDPGIRKMLTAPEIAGQAVLSWAVEGCLEWQADGLGETPQQILEATADYKEDMDPIIDWLRERTADVEYAITSVKHLYDSFIGWATSNHITKPLGSKKFSQHLQQKYERDSSRSVGRRFVGIGLLVENTTLFGGGDNPDSDTEGHLQSVPQLDTNKSFLKIPLHGDKHGYLASQVSHSVANQLQLQSVPTDRTLQEPSVPQVSQKCPACGGEKHWFRLTGEPVCSTCHPDPRAPQTQGS